MSKFLFLTHDVFYFIVLDRFQGLTFLVFILDIFIVICLLLILVLRKVWFIILVLILQVLLLKNYFVILLSNAGLLVISWALIAYLWLLDIFTG